MGKTAQLLICFMVCLGVHAQAQTWRSELYPQGWQPPIEADFYSDKLIQDFSYAGYHRGEKEIPFKARAVLDVTKPPYNADNTGTLDVTAILQKAIDDAGQRKQGGVVYLPKGTYQVNPVTDKNYCLRIARSHVVLRGAGPGETFLYNASSNMRSKAIISIENGNSWTGTGENKTLLTKDLLKPTSVIPVQQTTGLKVGDLIIIRNYIDNNWIEKHRMLDYWKDKGNSLHGQLYGRQVVAINKRAKEITLDIPIRYALETAHGAALYKAPPMLTEVGVEYMSIGNRQSFVEGDWSEESYRDEKNGSYQCHDSWAIAIAHLYNGWVRQVNSYRPEGNSSDTHVLSNGIKVWQTMNVSIVDCSFKNPQYGGGGGNGYMYRVMGNETLLQGCVADSSRHGFVLSHMSASGNVFFRCLDKNSGSQKGLVGYQKTNGSGSDHHMHFSHSNLFDQCTVENSFFAAGWRKWGGSTIHGLTGAHSVYWNLSSNGSQAEAVQTQQGRYGYVIGTSGSKPGVRTSAWQAGTEFITAPEDFVEGKGVGNTLEPQSLFLDQKSRRLRKNDSKK
ncbi:hypothetical protein DXT99_01540 [Pontibacter diazotrophicus]|uniref:Rhamnogalacturonase A/B/Epimerase-like pectate lyase domain-containing protein n=1 Tax=Pontibacter diazotrophicus TaxID=1400979 RepID=A0A3D8LIQ5_9BACT|nr:glycosyl hydrolase family 28-related protein [Pontibacter diazotrophicus]RDV17216.1 hypothetical protein DXT99_01540 [Pontibacter diazotrophicus]